MLCNCYNNIFSGSGRRSKKFTFDVFIAHDKDDEDFVMQYLVPVLDDTYSCCFECRNFTPGAYRTDSISEALEKSCVTLLVVSKKHMEFGLGRVVSHIAFGNQLQQRRLLPVQIDDCKVSTCRLCLVLCGLVLFRLFTKLVYLYRRCIVMFLMLFCYILTGVILSEIKYKKTYHCCRSHQSLKHLLWWNLTGKTHQNHRILLDKQSQKTPIYFQVSVLSKSNMPEITINNNSDG